MAVITLKFSKCRSAEDIHKVIKEAFSFPDYYGANLDAFYDCLLEQSQKRMNIRIKGISHLQGTAEECAFGALNVIKDVHHDFKNIKYKILS